MVSFCSNRLTLMREIVPGIFLEKEDSNVIFRIAESFTVEDEETVCHSLIYEIKECIRKAAQTEHPVWIHVRVQLWIEDLEDYVDMLTHVALALADEETVAYSLQGLLGTVIVLEKNPEFVKSIQEVLSWIPQSRPILFKTSEDLDLSHE